ncbi:MAG: hypothetical protein AAGL29_04665 [Bacteroidota bacterium]
MKKYALALLLGCLFAWFNFSCENNTDNFTDIILDENGDETDSTEDDDDTSEDDMDESDENDDGTDDTDENDSTNGTEVLLIASADILSNEGEGEQAWDDVVSLSAVKINSDPGRVVFEKRFRDDGFGVAGGRWEQIDYYYEYQGEVVKASEQLMVSFSVPVTQVMLQVGQMDPGEGRQAQEGKTCADGGTNRVDESGKWTAYDASGAEIGTGILLDEFSLEGKLPDSMGSYRFLLDTGQQNISKIVIEAIQWGGEERGCPTYRASYANQALNDSGNTENNSEFNLMALGYTKA